MAELKLTTAEQVQLSRDAAASNEAVRKSQLDTLGAGRVSHSGLETRLGQNEHPAASGLPTSSVTVSVNGQQQVSAVVRIPSESTVQTSVSGSVSVHVHAVEALDVLSTGKQKITITSVIRRTTSGQVLQATGVEDTDFFVDSAAGTIKILAGSNLITSAGEEVAITFDAPQILDGPALEAITSGVQVKLGTDHHQAARGDHSHTDLHKKAFAKDSSSIDLTIDPDTQEIYAVVKLDPAGDLVSTGNGLALASGVPRAGHTHPAVTLSNAGFMQPEHLSALKTASGLPGPNQYVNTDSLELSRDINGQVSGVVRVASGLKVTAQGVAPDWNEIAAKSHTHARVTAQAAGFMHPDNLAMLSGVNDRVTSLEAQDVIHGSGINKNSGDIATHGSRLDTNEANITTLQSGLNNKADKSELAGKSDVGHKHVKADISDADFACLEADVNRYQEALRLMPRHLRVEMPKTGELETVGQTVSEVQLIGIAAQIYTLKLRVRGACETKNHQNGVVRSESPYLYEDGEIVPSPWNEYRLEIVRGGSVIKTYWPNHSSDLETIFPDYQWEISVYGNDVLRLVSNSADDLQLEPATGVPALFPDKISGVGAYEGQFLEIEPVQITSCKLTSDRHDLTEHPELAALRDQLRLTRIAAGGADAPVHAIEVIGENVWVGGDFDHFGGSRTPGLAKLKTANLEDLKPDPTFEPGAGFTERIDTIGQLYHSGVNRVAVGSQARGYANDGGDATGGRQMFIIDDAGNLKLDFVAPLYIPAEGGLIGPTDASRDDRVVDVVGLSDGNMAVATPRTVAILNATGGVVRRIPVTERVNALLDAGDGAQFLALTHSMSGVNPVIYNEPGGLVNPKGAKLMNPNGLDIDSTWQNTDKAGTGAGSSCNTAAKGTDANGDYFVIGNGLTNFTGPDTSWNKDELGNMLRYSEQLDVQLWSGVNIWQRVGSNTTVTPNVQPAPDLTVTADSVADEDGVDQAYIYQEVTIGDDNSRYEFSIHIKKDTNEARFPIIQMKFTGGTTEIDAYGYLNTKTGAFLKSGDATANVEVQTVGDYWRVLVSASNNSTGNTTLRVAVHPAYTDTWNGAAEAITGSGVMWGAGLTNTLWKRDYVKTEENTQLPGSGINNSALFEGMYKIRRDGSADNNWDASVQLSEVGHVNVFGIDKDERVYFGGPVSTIDQTSVTPWRLYRVSPDGTFSKAFNDFNGKVNIARVTPCQRILVGGEFTQYGNQNVGFIVLINPDGTIATDDTIIYGETEPDTVVRPDYESRIWIKKSECPIVPRIWDCDLNEWVPLGSAGLPKLPCPVFNPEPPGNANTSGVQLSVPGFTNPEPAIYWTDDGSTPTDQSNLYSGVPIPLTARETTIKTFGRLQNYKDSDVCTGTFIITPQLPCPIFTPGNGAAPPVSVQLSVDGHSDANIYYTTVSGLNDPPDPTTNDTLYNSSSPIAVNHTMCIEAFATKTGYKDSKICKACYQPPVYGQDLPDVEFSPPSGSFHCLPVDVTLSVPGHPDATIYYTLDGSTPDFTSPQYTGPVAVGEGVTIKAFGAKLGWNPSGVTQASYQKDTVDDPAISPQTGEVPVQVTITVATAGATIHYTTDGSDPTSSDPIYTGPFQVSSPSTVKAKAYKSGCNPSGIVSATYTSGPTSSDPVATWKDSNLAVRFGQGANTGDLICLNGEQSGGNRWTSKSIQASAIGSGASIIEVAVDLTGDIIVVMGAQSGNYKMWVCDNPNATTPDFTEIADFGPNLSDRHWIAGIGPNTFWVTNNDKNPVKVYRINRSFIGSKSTNILKLHTTFTPATDDGSGNNIVFLDEGYAYGGDDTIARIVDYGSYSYKLQVSRDFGVNWTEYATDLGVPSTQRWAWLSIAGRAQISPDGSLISAFSTYNHPNYAGQKYLYLFKLDMESPKDAVVISGYYGTGLYGSSRPYDTEFDKLGRWARIHSGSTRIRWDGVTAHSSGSSYDDSVNELVSGHRVTEAVRTTSGGASASCFGWGEDTEAIGDVFVYFNYGLDVFGMWRMDAVGDRWAYMVGSTEFAIIDSPWNFRAKFDGTTPISTDHQIHSMFLSAAHVLRRTTDGVFTPTAPMFTSSIPALTANSDQGYTVSAESENGSNNAFKAFDGDDSTQWEATADDHWLKIQLASAKAFGALKLQVEAGDIASWPIDSVLIEGSHDDSNWEEIVTPLSAAGGATGLFNNSSTAYIHLPNSNSYTYYRLTFGMSSGNAKIKTVEFSEHPTPQLRVINFETGRASSNMLSKDFTHAASGTPTFDPASGSEIPSQQPLTIGDGGTDGNLHYTLNGATPDDHDTLYGGPFNIIPTWTIKAINDAGHRGYAASAVATATYSQAQVATPVASPTGGAVQEGTDVTLTCATAGAAIYYTTDGSTPDNTDTLYTGPIDLTSLATNVTIKAIGIKAGYTDSAVMSETYSKLTQSTPGIGGILGVGTASGQAWDSLAAGSTTIPFPSVIFPSHDRVTAHIHYTTDGSTPDNTDPSMVPGQLPASFTNISAGTKYDYDWNIPALTALVDQGYTVDDNGANADAWKAFDHAAQGPAGLYTTGDWIRIQMPSARCLIGFNFIFQNPTGDGADTDSIVKARIQGSNDGSSWTDLVQFNSDDYDGTSYKTHSVTATGNGLIQDRVCSVTNDKLSKSTGYGTEYSYYRLLIDNVSTDNISIRELDYMFGIRVASAVTLKLVAVETGTNDSAAFSRAFTQAQAAAPTADPAGPNIPFPDTGETEADIALATTTPNGTIKYTTNGAAPSGGSTYSGPITITAGTRVRAITERNGYLDSTELDVTYAKEQLAQPTFTPAGGAGVQQVTLSHAVSGVSIYYTLDGSDPSVGSNPNRFLYSSPIAIGPPVTVKAYADKTGYTDSTVRSESYT